MRKRLRLPRAATRGAIVWVIFAAALLTVIAAIYTPGRPAAPFHEIGFFLEVRYWPARPLRLAASLIASGVVGACYGAIASRLDRSPLVHVMWLTVLAFPALFLTAAVAVAIIAGPEAAEVGWTTAVRELPLGVLLVALHGMGQLLPGAALPIILAAITLEPWTRPE